MSRLRRPKKPPKTRNIAARALRDPLFRARVERNPNAYTRKGTNRRSAVTPRERQEDDED